jgi:hypothetical protein
MTYLWLQFLQDCAAECPAIPDAPPWMPQTRELVGKKGKAKFVECSNVWTLSAEAISRWLPPDVDNFMAAWKEIADALRAAREEATPHWDAKHFKLTYKGETIKQLNTGATARIVLLNLLEKARWSGSVDEPDEWKKGEELKQFCSTMDQLNKNHFKKKHITEHLLHFAMDGCSATTILFLQRQLEFPSKY